MSFADALAQAAPENQTRLCKLGRWATTLTETDREALEQALAGPTQTATILRAVKTMGADMGYATLARHRRGECDCP